VSAPREVSRISKSTNRPARGALWNPSLLDTPKACDMLDRWKRDGISIGCALARTFLRTQSSRHASDACDGLSEFPGKAGAPAMGQTEAASDGTYAGSSARPPLPSARPAMSLKRVRSFPRCMELVLPPPIGDCGMRIAEYLGEVPARYGSWRSEEKA